MMASKSEIKSEAQDTREALRSALEALDDLHFDDAQDFASQAASCAVEVETLIALYVAEHTDSRFSSGEKARG
jgi:hypothetical protein